MEKTEYLGLSKPQKREFYGIDIFNENADIIDEALKELDAHDTTLPMTIVSAGSTEEEINNFYDNYSAGMGNHTKYQAVIEIPIAHSVLGGGTYTLDGFKFTDDWEWQEITSYYIKWTRSKNSGKWSKWKRVDIGNVLTASKSVYVNPDGSDTDGDGSQSKPWKTIQKAADMCPINSNGDATYTIKLKAGTYSRANLYNIQTPITITGETVSSVEDADNYIITGNPITVKNCKRLILKGLTLNNGVSSEIVNCNSSHVDIIYCKSEASFLRAVNGSYMDVSYSNLSNCANRKGHGAIHCEASVCALTNVTFTGNTVDIACGTHAGKGGIVYIGVSCILSGGLLLTHYGGRILTGSQGWQTIGSVTGAKSVAIDSEKYTEFLVTLKSGSAGLCSIVIPVKNMGEPHYAGRYANSANIIYMCIITINSRIELQDSLNNGTDNKANTTMTVYGRRV